MSNMIVLNSTIKLKYKVNTYKAKRKISLHMETSLIVGLIQTE